MRKDERPAGEDVESSRALVETEDYYIEDGLMVLTSEFLADAVTAAKTRAGTTRIRKTRAKIGITEGIPPARCERISGLRSGRRHLPQRQPQQ